jgi:hypothetical protein
MELAPASAGAPSRMGTHAPPLVVSKATKQTSYQGGRMRATTAFNRILQIVGATVSAVTFTPEGVVVDLRRRRAKHRCPRGWKTWSVYDRSVRRWRHLDLGAARCFLEAEIARLDCKRCGRVRTEEVPWARPGARHSKDFCDVVAWMAQRVDKTTITKLLRVSWEAVAKIVVDVVAGSIDEHRLDDVYRIGVDEVSYRKGHRYLTIVADHDRQGAVIWAAEGKDHRVLEVWAPKCRSRRICSPIRTLLARVECAVHRCSNHDERSRPAEADRYRSRASTPASTGHADLADGMTAWPLEVGPVRTGYAATG